MTRRALLVGINRYDNMVGELHWCIDDALAMREVLVYHANQDANFACHTLLGNQLVADFDPVEPDGAGERVTFSRLREALEELFKFKGTVAFYYSGHGIVTPEGTYLATQDGTATLPG